MRQPLVYLFEDDRSLQRLLLEVIRDELGAAVVLCSGLAELREQSGQQVPEAIVADFWGTSQLQLSDDERAQITALSQMAPLVLVSGRRWVADLTPAELGVAALVGKPLDLDEFIEVLRQALAGGAGLPASELSAEHAEDLPPREALSVYFLLPP